MPKKTFADARKARVTLITQVKDNQETLKKQLEHGMRISKPIDKFESKWELAHGRIEHRTCEIFEAALCLRKFPEWKEIYQMIRLHRTREIKGGKESTEEAIYVCNGNLSAEKCFSYIREHWWIENKLNYVRDVSFEEDSSKRHINPINFSTCISFALNIIRKKKETCKQKLQSIKGLLFENCMVLEKALNLVL